MVEKTPYTPGLRDVLKLSMNEAGRLGHDFVGPEHYMLGIIRKNQGYAVRALTNLGVDLNELRISIEAQLEKGKKPTVGLFMPNDKARRVKLLAHTIAQELNHGWIGSEHLLLALTRTEDTISAKCLLQFGVDSEKTQREIIKLLENY